MDVRMFTVGPVQENCFLVRRDGADRAVIVDPGEEAPRLLARDRGARASTLEAILLTHTHFDHVGAVAPGRAGDRRAGLLPGARGAGPRGHHGLRAVAGFGPFESYEAEHTVAGGETLELAGLRHRRHLHARATAPAT